MPDSAFVFLPFSLIFTPFSFLFFSIFYFFFFAVFSMRTGAVSFSGYGHQNLVPYFLEACFLCRKSLGNDRDIFMYRGNTPFCSKECRRELIEMEEAKEKKCRPSSGSARGSRKSEAGKKSVRTGTVAVA